MSVDSYLELFTTLFGWAFYGVLWDVLVATGIVYLPFLGILIDNWREPAEGGEFGTVTGQHHHQQRDEELDLHAPQRQTRHRTELTAFGRFPPVVDQDAEERQVDDAGTHQHVPQHAVEGPAEQGREQLEVAVDPHTMGPVVTAKIRPSRFCPSTSSRPKSHPTTRQRCARRSSRLPSATRPFR